MEVRKRPQYFDNIPCPHCRNINNPDVCKKCFYDSEYKPKQWHADAMAVPKHLKTVFSPFPNYYHPDGVFKLNGEKNEYRRNYHETCNDSGK